MQTNDFGEVVVPVRPVPKPRMTRSDKWRVRPAVLRYRQYADALRLAVPKGYELPESVRIIFGIPMPKHWSSKKRAAAVGRPHKQKPDTDNLTKAVKDALAPEDSYIWNEWSTKVWDEDGFVSIKELDL